MDFITLLVENKYSVNHGKSCISSKVLLTYKYTCHTHLGGTGNERALPLSHLPNYNPGDLLPLQLAVAF